VPRAAANGIELEYESFGSTEDPLVLLVMGFGAQLTNWDPRFCEQLAEAGPFHVVRFDNRDVGLSSRVVDGGYTLDDLADDAAALARTLGYERAHVVGASMGGMIVQLVAIRHPELTASLCSIMSTPHTSIGPATERARAALLAPAPDGRDGAIRASVDAARIFSPVHFDEAKAAERAAAAYDRAFDPEGKARQLAAIIASTDRTEALGSVTAPTLVIHGALDEAITLEGGEATAKAVPGAELLVIDDMGHDLPEPRWPEIIGAIATNARRASS
jgi:pimeloyl-ACP methyl ester carboxylesterase